MMNFIVGFLAAVLSAMGMGGGSILLMYLTAGLGMDQLQAQGLNLAFFIPVACVALFFHFKNKLVDIKRAAIFTASGLLGVWAGAGLAGWMDRGMLSKCFGGLLLVMGVKGLWPGKKKEGANRAE